MRCNQGVRFRAEGLGFRVLDHFFGLQRRGGGVRAWLETCLSGAQGRVG